MVIDPITVGAGLAIWATFKAMFPVKCEGCGEVFSKGTRLHKIRYNGPGKSIIKKTVCGDCYNALKRGIAK